MQDKIKSPPGGTLKLSSLGPPVITSRDVDRIIYIDFLHYFTFPCSSLFPVTGLAQPLLSDPVLLNTTILFLFFLDQPFSYCASTHFPGLSTYSGIMPSSSSSTYYRRCYTAPALVRANIILTMPLVRKSHMTTLTSSLYLLKVQVTATEMQSKNPSTPQDNSGQMTQKALSFKIITFPRKNNIIYYYSQC